jgi:alpha-1,2-glucosyltransferase
VLINFLATVLWIYCNKGSADAWAHAAALWLYPPSFFFTFLFYTDPGSTFFVLLSYLLAQPSQSSSSKLNSRSLPFYRLIGSAAAGCVAVLFRQTNAVWCAFILAAAVLHDVCTKTTERSAVAAAAAAAKKSDDTTVTTDDTSASSVLLGPVCISPIIRFAAAIVTDLRGILQRLWPLLVPVLSFAVFLAKNGSIVVGDKQHHSSVVHLAQLCYAAAAASAMYTSPLVNEGLISTANMKQLLAYTQRQFATVRSAVASCAVLTLAAAALAYSSKAHPFLLADNRHYTFYIWQRWLGKGAVYRCALLPVYGYTAWSVLHRLCIVRSQLWTLMLVCVTAAVIVPAELLEVRYFTVPVLLVQLNSPQRSHAALLSTALACAAVNVLLVYVFLYKPFAWPDGTVARFIW